MKKIYIQPTLEIMPLGAMQALCTSPGGGEEPGGLINSEEGSNPWTGGRGPRNTVVF